MKNSIVIALFAFVIVTSSYANTTTQLSSQQKAEAAKIGGLFSNMCLTQKPKVSVASGFMDDLQDFSGDPKYCTCLGKKVEQSITPSFFSFDEKKAKEFMNRNFVRIGMECSVPIFKERFYESCKNSFTEMYIKKGNEVTQEKLKKLGYETPDEFIVKSCTCASESMQNISTKEWIDSSIASYNNHVESKNMNQPKKELETPLSIALNKCIPMEP